MPVVVLDLVLVLVFLAQLARGWRAGLVVRALDLAGFVGGALLALWAAPRLIALVGGGVDQLGTALLLLAVVLVGATLGEGLLGGVGRGIARANPSRTLRRVDQLVGAVASLVVVALTSWFVATAVKPVVPPTWARVIDGSAVLRTVDPWVPQPVNRWAASATAVLDAVGFPRVFSGLGAEPALPAEAPDAASARTPGVAAAADSVVKVQGVAPACRQAQEGSGWVVAAERVVTNAHVVAGTDSVTVQVGGAGRAWPATVVSFDPSLDLAVLAVPGLTAQPLERAGAQAPGTQAVVAGFPGNGPYRVVPSTVRGTIRAQGDDIYGTSGVEREVYALYTDVHPGNSGGPLLTTDGRVAGTVFAKSATEASTGYALTDAATEGVLQAAAADRTPASTGACVRG